MATSGVITSSKTAADIVAEAYWEIRVVAQGREPNATQGRIGLSKLNDMLKEWQADGVNLWREADVEIPWPAATADGTVTPRYLDLHDLRVVSGATERMLQPWGRSEYAALPNKSTPGTPTLYNIIRDRDALRLRLWPVPAAPVTLKATGVRVIEDVTNGAETLDIPQEWTSTVVMNLAARLANTNGRADPNVQSVMAEASRLYGKLRAFDSPDSIFMESA